MSASSKKKLRREQEAAQLTEKQLTAQKEAKQTKLITAAFVAVMVVILVIAIVVGVKQTITSNGILEKNTTALTVGEHKLSNAELNYFYMDAVNNFYSSYGSYASMFGLDVSKPLNEQVVDESTGLTWADDFLESAKNNAVQIYALADEAEAAGYTLSEAEQAEVDNQISNIELYASLYGYSDGDQYLKALYGNGADVDGYMEYVQLNTLASSYYNHYAEQLTYEDADLRTKEKEDFSAYSSYSYNAYYMATSRFLTGGTTDENGSTTYSDEENAAAAEAVKAAAEELKGQDFASVAKFDAAIAALSINADSSASSTAYADTLATSINSIYADWVTDDARKAGDFEIFPYTSTSTAEDGTETTTVNGYYAVYYVDSTDNTFA